MSRLVERFLGEEGYRLRVEAMIAHKLVRGNSELASELANALDIIQIEKGSIIIEQDDGGNDIFFIISGSLAILINGRKIGARGPGECVGEMAAVEPTQRRSATVEADEVSIVGRIDEPKFSEIAYKYPDLYRNIAKELAHKLLQRNSTIGSYRDKIRVFIISSGEAAAVARIIQTALSHDFLVVLWTDGVFKVSNYPIQSLEAELETADFAIAVAHSDDITESRGKNWPSPRDNVIFELGMFMGRLNRERAILMEPREEKVKLPSDLAGITTITYRYEAGQDVHALMAPACNILREHILRLGPFNG